LCKTIEASGNEIDVAVKALLAGFAIESYPLAKDWTCNLVETLRTNALPKDQQGGLETQLDPHRDRAGAPC